MNRNVIKFNPNDRSRKRPAPAPFNEPHNRSNLRGILKAASVILLFVALVLAVYWIYEGRNPEPNTSLAQISGTASVIDGDTIEIHGERIRLDGYDAPERGSVCGTVNVYQKASLALANLIGRKTVSCRTKGKDRHNRFIASCEVGGQSVAEYMVEQGWARDWPRYSKRAYADEERRARNAKRGIWGLDCPSDLWGNRTYN